MKDDLNTRQRVERICVGSDQPSSGRDCSRSDDQVVRPTRPALPADVRQQRGMSVRDGEVVVDDRQHSHQTIHERSPCGLPASRRQLDANRQLCDRDRSDGSIIVITDYVVEIDPALDVDEEGCVE